MAEKTLIESVEKEVNCSICLDTYTNPKILQCHHTFCQDCLKRLVHKNHQGQCSLTCPFCSGVTNLPANGVEGLLPVFSANSLTDIVERFKAETYENSCEAHTGEKLKLYCKDCAELLCASCAIKGAKHHSHNYKPVAEVFEELKGEVMLSKTPAEKQLESIIEAVGKLELRCAELTDQQKGIEAEIHVTFRPLYDILDDRKAKLISRLDQITQNKLGRLIAQREEFEMKQGELSSWLGFIGSDFIMRENKMKILAMKTDLLKQGKDLVANEPRFLEPNAEADMVLSASSAGVTEMCRKFGQVYAPDLADPSRCRIMSKSYIVVIGREATAIFQAVNFNGKPCKSMVMSLEGELVSATGASVRAKVERKEQSQYSINYTPTTAGTQWLTIKVADEHIKGSPFAVKVAVDEKSHFYLGTIFGI